MYQSRGHMGHGAAEAAYHIRSRSREGDGEADAEVALHVEVSRPGVPTDDAGACALDRVRIPTDGMIFTEVGREGGLNHINIEEGAACTWGTEGRLRRPG